MGIQGIYKEIGPGKRVSLCKLAIEHLEETGQPLRLAIDFAIWSFQAQAARGGAHPAIRTLFYRLVRLLSLTVHPIFVFDGPNKPAFKRHRRSRRGPGDTVSASMAKRLIRLFGFAVHDAPGEAEAECAFLQREGVVDAVLSEDVDTIMFGCGRTLRNWSAESTAAGSRPPTHVSVYDAAELSLGVGSGAGLDREALVLVALMSGGDYIPEGVPGCGVKVACEAARAGFGRRLCRIKRSDPDALRRWREELASELRTNESGFFRVRHKALTIPEDFPDMEVLRYYTHPVVSQAATVERLRKELPARANVDIVGLRAFTGETFDWTYKIGAIKFIKVLAPGLLIQALLGLHGHDINDPDERERAEAKLVRAISTRRTHFSTDATPELRISYIPNDIVSLDLDAEEDGEEIAPSTHGRSGLALNSDNETEGPDDGEGGQAKADPKKVFDPLQPDLVWVPESVAKLGVPLAVEDWETGQRAKKSAKEKKKNDSNNKVSTRKSQARQKTSDMPAGALDRYLTSTKSISPAKT
ncbi:PIN domain-like protein, partial [Cryphonectria parasitica EP155]